MSPPLGITWALGGMNLTRLKAAAARENILTREVSSQRLCMQSIEAHVSISREMLSPNRHGRCRLRAPALEKERLRQRRRPDETLHHFRITSLHPLRHNIDKSSSQGARERIEENGGGRGGRVGVQGHDDRFRLDIFPFPPPTDWILVAHLHGASAANAGARPPWRACATKVCEGSMRVSFPPDCG